ncbi:MAG: hypothetical protein J6I85_02155 [Clostridia bacterium]|nr:hypothetical protein [Clostridia bacterium]
MKVVDIFYFGKMIEFITNDDELYSCIKEEYSEYFKFVGDIKKSNDIKLKVINSAELYLKYFEYFKSKKKTKIKNDIYMDIRRENIVLINKCNKEIYIVYDKFNDERLEYIEEIISSVFGKLLEFDGVFFVDAICIEKNKKGILILGNDKNSKIITMLRLLQEGSNYISSRLVGIKDNYCLAFPNRVGINKKVIDNKLILEKYNKELLKKAGTEEKFNVTVKDIKKIFDIETVTNIELCAIVEIYTYSINDYEFINKKEKADLIQTLMFNKRTGIYKPVNYIINLFSENNNKNIEINMRKIVNIPSYNILINNNNFDKSIENILKLMK